MKALVPAMVFVLALTTTTSSWSQGNENNKAEDDHWEAYQPRSIQSIIDAHQLADLDHDYKTKATFLTADSFPSHINLVFLEESRPLPATKKILMDAWRRMLGEKAPPAGLFVTEVLFREGTKTHWIAVQQPLLDSLHKEVKNGQTVNAYIIWIGAIRVSKTWEWLFAMNEFEASQPGANNSAP
jgi:hypothetical protein